jgi:hypothetical protein
MDVEAGMTDPKRTAYSSSNGRQVCFSEIVIVINDNTFDNFDVEEKCKDDSISSKNANQLMGLPELNKDNNGNAYIAKNDDVDTQSTHMPSIDNSVVTDAPLHIDQDCIAPSNSHDEGSDNDSLDNDDSKNNEAEENGFISFLAGAMGLIAFITASAGIFRCLYKWLCMNQGLPTDHDDIIAATAMASNMDKGFIFVMPGDGGSSFVS